MSNRTRVISQDELATALKALDVYLDKQRQKGLSVEMLKPPYTEETSYVRCHVLIGGKECRLYYRPTKTCWMRSYRRK